MRGFFLFDTSAIGADTVDSAAFSVYVATTLNNDNDGNDFGTVVGSAPAANTAIATADYDQVGATEYIDLGQRKDISSISTGAYLDFTLNSTRPIKRGEWHHETGRCARDTTSSMIEPTARSETTISLGYSCRSDRHLE